MPGLPYIRPAPELPPGPRVALVIATARYADSQLGKLRAPTRDAEDLAAVLGDPGIGGFAVTTVTDQEESKIRREIASFLSSCDASHLAMVYLSCHGVLDARGRLYFAAADTEKAQLAATAIESAWLMSRLDECHARRRVLILDCCFSGAFAEGGKGSADLELERRVAGHGRGLAVLTASRASEYSFEGKPLTGRPEVGSVFTTGLIEGMRSGAADADGDGYVSLDEAYDFAYRHVQARGASQTPQRWLYGGEGTSTVLARSASGIKITPIPLPEFITSSLDNPHPRVRLGAVATLADWLADPDSSRAVTALQELQRIAATDSPAVATVARTHLATVLEPTAPPGLVPVPTEPESLASRIGRKQRVWVVASAGGLALALLALLVSPFWPRYHPRQHSSPALLSSCKPAALPRSATVTRQESSSPLMYKVSSTVTLPGDATAVAHGFYRHGWMQQAFVATRNKVSEVSAVISTSGKIRTPLSIGFQIRTLHNSIIGSVVGDYNGSTDNNYFDNHFKEPVQLSVGSIYILRVINYSTRYIFIYAHYVDEVQYSPYLAAACEYDSGDDSGHMLTLRADSRNVQLLSGILKGPAA